MLEANLTDRKFWANYWANYQYEKIPKKTPFEYLMSKFKGKNSFIEIGGFPGVYAVYFYKHGCKEVSLLDFFIDNRMINKFEEKNSIPSNTIKSIESDFFKYETDKKYDIVFSFGFIEHFNDTKDVISRHVKLLADKGILLMIIPNFRGINGLFQRIFDKSNFDAHNLQSMKKEHLKNILSELGLKNIKVEYSRKPMVWLEPQIGTNFGRMCVKLFSYALKLFPVKCRLLSPFIIIYAEFS
ncbi:MAG: class I SAM-dependent methyltransferase [Prevotellaceae bacterium]|jgi:SAM-dependent methyltransferase|nr:class I SAM-dependent methyltransferase [Prevotellaceae bacterium]